MRSNTWCLCCPRFCSFLIWHLCVCTVVVLSIPIMTFLKQNNSKCQKYFYRYDIPSILSSFRLRLFLRHTITITIITIAHSSPTTIPTILPVPNDGSSINRIYSIYNMWQISSNTQIYKIVGTFVAMIVHVFWIYN